MILVYSVVLDLYKGAKYLFTDAAYFASVTGDLKNFERIDSPDRLKFLRSLALESGLRFNVITV